MTYGIKISLQYKSVQLDFELRVPGKPELTIIKSILLGNSEILSSFKSHF